MSLLLLFFFESLRCPPWGLHHGRRQGLHDLLFFFFLPFILLGSASPLMCFCFLFSFLLPTLARLRCLYPCCCHHLSLSRGSFALVGPSSVALRALPTSFFCFFYLFFVCTTAKPLPPSRRCCPCGGLVLSGLVLAMSGAARHPLWWFPFGRAASE